jgi:hypothetical protein
MSAQDKTIHCSSAQTANSCAACEDCKAPQALWSAAACCRFCPASLLAPHRPKRRPSVHGQQAGLRESGSKLPHSRARFWWRQLGRAVVKAGGLTFAALALANPFLPAPQEKALPFERGERLTYDVTWSIFAAGTVTATLGSEGQAPKDNYTVTTTAHSQGFVSLLFNVQNEFRSFFNPQTLCSERISKKINEGRRHKETEIVFDSQRKRAILDERDLNKPHEPPKHAENEIPNCVEDVVTAFYYLRNQDFRIGKPLHLPVNDGSKTYDVTLDVQARERIQTPLGNRLAIRVEPKVFSGLFKRKGRMLVWFSDDDQRLPLRIKFMIAVGPITATLKSVTRIKE